MRIRYHLFFSGNVQGVGFRYTARALAEKYSLTGWAKNLADGKVEVEVEGGGRDVDGFLEDLHAEFKEYIKDVEKEELPVTSVNEGFYIKF